MGFNNALIWFPFIRKGIENTHKIAGSRSSKYATSSKTCLEDTVVPTKDNRFGIVGSVRIHPQLMEIEV